MYTAQKTRKENIAEYILYLWQLEDLLRALQFSPEAIYAKLVKPLGLPEEQKQEVFLWYMDIVNLLREEGKEQQGHLEHTLHLIADLNNLHNQLTVLPVGAEYRRLYARVAPELPALKAKLKDPEISDVELFFRALYSVVLLRIQEAGKHGDAGKGCGTNPQAAADKDTDVSAAPDSIADSGKSRQKYIDDVLTLISPVVAELATVFRKVERGEVDLFGNAPNGDRHAEYRRLYARVAPELPALKAKLKDPEISDVELFFRALYSVVLLRIQEAGKHGDAGKGCGTNPQAAADKDTDVSAAPDSIADSGKSRQKYIDDVLTLISPVVAELATVFRKVERGEVDLFGNAPNGDRHAAAAPEQGTQASSGAQDGPRPAAVAPEGKNSRNSGTGSAS